MNSDSDLICHRTGRHEYGRFFAEQSRNFGLQFRDGRVNIDNVVTHLGLCHDFSHFSGGTGDSVASQVDHVGRHFFHSQVPRILNEWRAYHSADRPARGQLLPLAAVSHGLYDDQNSSQNMGLSGKSIPDLNSI